MSASPPLLVVGASLAGLRAVEEAREGGYMGRIVLVGAESHVPYDRPPLSKAFLHPEGLPDLLTSEAELRNTLGVELRLSSRAVSLDTASRSVRLQDGEMISYAKLIIATGADARTAPHLAGKDGVLTLRTLDDARDLRQRLERDVDVVVVGAGFIGAEVASTARKTGASVRIVEAAPVPLVRAVGAVVGQALSELHVRNGVQLMVDTQVVGLTGDHRVEGVTLSSGEVLPADVVIVGIGATPATSWLRDSGIALSPIDGGVLCDHMLRTSDPDVYAAGDVAHFRGHDQSIIRLENWTNAADQGRRAARNALWPESAIAYVTVPYFWSDWYGQRIQFVGSPVADEVSFVDGAPDSDRWVSLYRSGERLVGAATVNEPRKIMKFRRLIAQNSSWADALAVVHAGRPTAS